MTHQIAIYVKIYAAKYFNSFALEQIPKEIKTLIGNTFFREDIYIIHHIMQ